MAGDNTARIVTTVVYDLSDAPPAGQRGELTAALGNGLLAQIRASGLPEPTRVVTRDETEPMMSVPVDLMRAVIICNYDDLVPFTERLEALFEAATGEKLS